MGDRVPAAAVSPFELPADLRDALAGTTPLDEVLADCLGSVGRGFGAHLGAVWVHDPWYDGLRPIATWEAEGRACPGYAAARTASDTVDPGALAHDVFVAGRPRCVDDLVATDPAAATWAGDDRPAAYYLALRSGADPVGVVELVHDRSTTLDETVLTRVGDELGRAVALRIQRDMEEADRRRVQLALESRGVATWSYRFPSGMMTGDDRLAELYGLPPVESAEHFERYASLIFPEDRERTDEMASAAIERRERFEFRYRIRRPDGQVAWLEGAGIPIVGENDEIREITGVCYDVTAEMEARRALEEQARFAALAADVGRAFVRDEPLPDKLQRSTDAVVEHLDAAFARVWTVADEPDVLVLTASSGLYTHLDGAHARIRFGEFKIGRIAASLEPHLTNDVPNDPHISDRDWALTTGMQSFAGYPLVVGGRCVGVLAMFARHELPDGTLRALATVADTVAIGIEQSRQAEEVMALYGESNRHAATLEAALRDRARVAEVLQASLVPRSLPDVAGFGVAARYRPGIEEVGGDFYDILLVGGNRWAFMIGDICGRGPEAARLTALARHTLRLALMLGHSPVQALAMLNEALLRSDNDGRFCTAACGVITELADGSALVEVGVAGHPAPVVVQGDGVAFELDAAGTLLGVVSHAEFVATQARLRPGDALVVYTDGVVEARRHGEVFGVPRLLEVLSAQAGADATELVDSVLDGVTAFDESASKDDMAILAIRRSPEPVAAGSPPEPSSIDRA